MDKLQELLNKAKNNKSNKSFTLKEFIDKVKGHETTKQYNK